MQRRHREHRTAVTRRRIRRLETGRYSSTNPHEIPASANWSLHGAWTPNYDPQKLCAVQISVGITAHSDDRGLFCT